jgi:hypothetical protein
MEFIVRGCRTLWSNSVMESLTNDGSLVRHVETRDIYFCQWDGFVVECADGTVNASITVKVEPEFSSDSDSDDNDYYYNDHFVEDILVEIVEVDNKTVKKKA